MWQLTNSDSRYKFLAYRVYRTVWKYGVQDVTSKRQRHDRIGTRSENHGIANFLFRALQLKSEWTNVPFVINYSIIQIKLCRAISVMASLYNISICFRSQHYH